MPTTTVYHPDGCSAIPPFAEALLERQQVVGATGGCPERRQVTTRCDNEKAEAPRGLLPPLEARNALENRRCIPTGAMPRRLSRPTAA